MLPIPKFVVQREYRPQRTAAMEFRVGEQMEVLRQDEGTGWSCCRATNGDEGWIPTELLSFNGKDAIVLSDYSTREIEVNVGEEIEIEKECLDRVWVHTSRGSCGWIPSSHVQLSRGGSWDDPVRPNPKIGSSQP